jgi:hypothetical protein
MAPIRQLNDEESNAVPLPKPNQREGSTLQRMLRSGDTD